MSAAILPVGRIASYVELYDVADDSHAHGTLETGITEALVERHGLSNEFLDLGLDFPWGSGVALPTKGLA